MSFQITRMFGSAANANAAADELREEGFSDIFVVTPPTASDVPLSAIAAQIAQGRILLADAKVYAQGVAKGGSLVTVYAPFGAGQTATNILESHGTIPSGIAAPQPESMWDEAAPLSSILYMSTKLDDPTPMSKVMGVSALTSSDCSLSGMLGLPMLKSSAMGDRGRLGIRYLMDNPAPLSSLLGLPLLKESKRKNY
jgi:hypothetical protein